MRGKYRDVILPTTAIRRLDAVLEMKALLDKADIVHQCAALRQAAAQAFYNTGIATYVWVLTNRKPKALRFPEEIRTALLAVEKEAEGVLEKILGGGKS